MDRMSRVQSMAQLDDFDFFFGPAGKMEYEKQNDQNNGFGF
jgi:hypothetical protein